MSNQRSSPAPTLDQIQQEYFDLSKELDTRVAQKQIDHETRALWDRMEILCKEAKMSGGCVVTHDECTHEDKYIEGNASIPQIFSAFGEPAKPSSARRVYIDGALHTDGFQYK